MDVVLRLVIVLILPTHIIDCRVKTQKCYLKFFIQEETFFVGKKGITYHNFFPTQPDSVPWGCLFSLLFMRTGIVVRVM